MRGITDLFCIKTSDTTNLQFQDMPRKPIETKDDQQRQIGVEDSVKQIADSKLRTLLFHFHVFKNGGSTLDAALKKNFGDRWIAIEGPDPDVPMKTLRNAGTYT
jgi:hypothetical protein